MKKILAFAFLAALAGSVSGQTFTLSSPTNGMAAGTYTRAITIQISGTTSLTTTFTLTDGGASGNFWPTVPTISASTNGSTQFVYIPNASATGTITLQAVAAGGLVQTVTLPMPIETDATIKASDGFGGSAASAVIGSTAALGGVWTQGYNSGTSIPYANGSNGMYNSGTGTASKIIYLPTSASTSECDIVTTVTNSNLTKTNIGVSLAAPGTNLSQYWMTGDATPSWYLIKYVASTPTVFFTDTTHQNPLNAGNYTMDIAIRQVNGLQEIWAIVNGVSGSSAVNGGVPVQDSTYSCASAYGGYDLYIKSGQTPASTDSVYSNFAVTDVDWGIRFTASPSTIYSGQSGNITLTLSGQETTWTGGGTTFSVSGVSGVTKVSQNVTSNTAATLVVNTLGSGTGTMTISDGTYTYPVSIIGPPVIVTYPTTSCTLSPYTWRIPGDGTAWASGPGGPYQKCQFTGSTQVLANVDTTINSCDATDMPTFKVVVNDGAPTFVQLGTSATQVTLATGLTSGNTNTIQIWAIDGGTSCGNGWSATYPMLHLQSLQFDNGTTFSAFPNLQSGSCLVFGASYETGYDGGSYSSGTTPYYTVVDPSLAWSQQIPWSSLGCEVGVVGVGSQGFLQPGNNSYPDVQTTWNYYDSTHTRNLSPAPAYLFNHFGENDHRSSWTALQVTNACESLLNAQRSALPTTTLVIVIPPGGAAADEDGSGGANAAPIRACVAAIGDPNTVLLDFGTRFVPYFPFTTPVTSLSPNDGIHPGWSWGSNALTSAILQGAQKGVDAIGRIVGAIVVF